MTINILKTYKTTMKTHTQMFIFLIILAMVILFSFDFLLKLDNSRRSEREVVVTLPVKN